MVIFNIIIVLSLLSLMIIVHEFGHWIVARRLGFQTPFFGFGLPFGKHITLGKWKDTEFRFHWFILGGYVAIPELGDESSEELIKEVPDLKPLQTFPVWKRAAVASAGVAFNILFAYLICLVMVATIGSPSLKGNVMITNLFDNKQEANEFHTKQNLIAKEAGLKVKDIILSINNSPAKDPTSVSKIIRSNGLKPLTFQVERTYIVNNKKQKEKLNILVTPNKNGEIGVGLGMGSNGEYSKPSKNPLKWLYQAAKIMIFWTLNMLIGLFMMIINLFGFSLAGSPKVRADDLHGVIAIVSVFAQAITIDFREIFKWTAMININLAIVNLLPIPALDGGHLMFMFIEKIRGKKLAESFQQKAIQMGFMALMALMFFVLFNDIKGIFTGKFDMNKKEKLESHK